MSFISEKGSISKDLLPSGSFHARGSRPLSLEEVEQILNQSAQVVVQADENSENIESFRKDLFDIYRRVLGDRNILESINSWAHLVSANINRGQLKIERPEIAVHIDAIGHIAKAKIAIALHPEKIEELAGLLREQNLVSWNVNTFRKQKWIKQKHWFSNNVRSADGTIDWHLIAEKVNEIYPCEFSLKRARESFTLESALSSARIIADKFIHLKGHWHPAGDIEEEDKQLYLNLIGRKEFRRPANRPDIHHRKDSRPNWYKIADAMGEKYSATMVLSQKGNEPLFRDFDDAVEELADLLDRLDSDQWSWNQVEQNYAALYAWFKNHLRTDTNEVDTKKVLAALPDPWRSRYWKLG